MAGSLLTNAGGRVAEEGYGFGLGSGEAGNCHEPGRRIHAPIAID